MARKLKLRIWRGDATDGALKNVEVDVNEGEVVLDVIHRVQATQMGDLAVRWNCKPANVDLVQWRSMANHVLLA